MSKSQKGEKGQYFTPRYVIDMCVRMMNPQKHENIIDTAAGSCGFTVHSIFYVWKAIRKENNLPIGEGFTADERTEEELNFVRDHIFAIDFDEKAVRVARTLNLIAGDGQSNVIHLNTLDYGRWGEIIKEESWNDNYNNGFKKLKKTRPKGTAADNYSRFNFDLLMANPPFAGDIKEGNILARYELGKNDKSKQQSKVGRDILFIERNLNFLKPGGRMAIVLPQGRFNNSTDKRIRDFIAEHCRILAVVGLHGNVFKPHTGTKTSVLFVQKWDDKLCPKLDEYPIFFATMQKPSKDNSGDKIYISEDFVTYFEMTYKNKDSDDLSAFDKLEKTVMTYPAFINKYGNIANATRYYSHELGKSIG
jgi:type I restriction enzyme M protein